MANAPKFKSKVNAENVVGAEETPVMEVPEEVTETPETTPETETPETHDTEEGGTEETVTEETVIETPEVTEETPEAPEEPEAPAVVFKEAPTTKTPPVQNVKIRICKDHVCTIGGETYSFTKGKVEIVPENVKAILSRAGLLLPL